MISLMISLPDTMTKESYSLLNQPTKWLEIAAKHMNQFEDSQQRQILLLIIRFFLIEETMETIFTKQSTALPLEVNH